jgi:ketosteroid isomerase-like protein
MSRENVELVKALQPVDNDLVELFTVENALDTPMLSASPDSFEDDFEVTFISGEPGVEIQRRGPEGLVDAWREWLAPWASYRMTLEDVLDAGDNVVVLVHVEGRTAHDDVLMTHDAAAVWSIRRGKITRIGFYLHREHALKAVGLPEQGGQPS